MMNAPVARARMEVPATICLTGIHVRVPLVLLERDVNQVCLINQLMHLKSSIKPGGLISF